MKTVKTATVKIPMNASRIMRLSKVEKTTGKTIDFILRQGLTNLASKK